MGTEVSTEVRSETEVKKTYEPPRLTVHGDVAEITGNTGPGNMDGLGGCSH